jgi:hypothetical protein
MPEGNAQIKKLKEGQTKPKELGGSKKWILKPGPRKYGYA